MPAFRGEAKETTWIYRVAFNTAMAWRRVKRRRREGHETFLKFDVSPQVQPGHTDSLAEQEVVQQLFAAIRQLPKVDASLALMHLNGLSYQEMVAVVGISENYIGVRLNRIRKQPLRQELEPELVVRRPGVSPPPPVRLPSPHSGVVRVAPCLVSPKTNSPSSAQRPVQLGARKAFSYQ